MQLSQCAVFFFLLAWNGGTTEIKNDESRNDERMDWQYCAKGGEVLGFLFEKYRPHYSWEEFLGIIIFVSIVNVVFKIRKKYFGKAKKKD